MWLVDGYVHESQRTCFQRYFLSNIYFGNDEGVPRMASEDRRDSIFWTLPLYSRRRVPNWISDTWTSNECPISDMVIDEFLCGKHVEISKNTLIGAEANHFLVLGFGWIKPYDETLYVMWYVSNESVILSSTMLRKLWKGHFGFLEWRRFKIIFLGRWKVTPQCPSLCAVEDTKYDSLFPETKSCPSTSHQSSFQRVSVLIGHLFWF